MIRKDVIFAILTTFCLCALMFTVIPIRSGQPYDPWADINDDGKINMYDIGYTAQKFGATGDSTKNVTVKDSVFTWFSGRQILASGQTWDSEVLSTVGFRQITVKVSANSTAYLTLLQDITAGSVSGNMIQEGRWVDIMGFTRTFDVLGTEFYLIISNMGNSTIEGTCWVYMNSIPSPNMNRGYDTQYVTVNVSQGSTTIYQMFSLGGYSRMSVRVFAGYAMMGDYDVTLYPYIVFWQGNSAEHLSPNDFNVTFTAHNGYLGQGVYSPLLLETKGEYCGLFWTILDSHNLPPNWWITFDVSVYLRNE